MTDERVYLLLVEFTAPEERIKAIQAMGNGMPNDRITVMTFNLSHESMRRILEELRTEIRNEPKTHEPKTLLGN